MGLFDHFKSKDIESMDELKQMDLKPKRNDKVLTADEAFKKSIQAQDTVISVLAVKNVMPSLSQKGK